ncbi:hypothetical protein THRCLA_21528 [Thraustotheca clavata]|uniref:Uncharacterized protein n=1 Tax=Thraustotheca clavata TaxID=74557 RepID=A0A1V9ZVG6_9STRA|nr:hypothetical protein THRCLA_21528 [Thraustotheca clavata]
MAPQQSSTNSANTTLKCVVSILTLKQSTLIDLAVPRHWLLFGLGCHAQTIDFLDGSVVHDGGLDQLKSVQSISFHQCDFIRNPTALKHCRSLSFISCDQLCDVQALDSVEILDISGSRNVQNIEQLTSIKSLTLGRGNFQSPKKLGAMEELTLTFSTFSSWLPHISDCYHIEHLHVKQCLLTLAQPARISATHVQLSSCENLQQLDFFAHVSSIAISRSRALKTCAFDEFQLLQSVRIQASTCLSNVTAFSSCQSVHLSLCVNLSDVNALKCCRSVEISCCPLVNDISQLSTVYDLTLHRCVDLASIDDLQQNHFLRVSECYRITHVGHLQHLHTLELVRCHRVVDSNALANGKHFAVTLSGCNITNVDAWYRHQTLHTMDLSNNHDLTSVDSLGFLHTLRLDSTGVISLESLRNLHSISLSGCDWIEDVSPLANAHTIDLSYCMSLENVAPLSHVHTLNLTGTNVSKVSCLQLVYDLNLTGCHSITDDEVNELIYIHTLVLDGCYQLTKVHGLKFVHSLSLANCIGIKDVSMLGHVHSLTLTGCLNIAEFAVE